MKNIIKPMLLLLAVAFIGSCSNLDESAFDIKPIDGADVIFSETFADGLGKFAVKNVSGAQTWAYYSNGYAIISGYENSVNNANEDWLISPEIDLTNVTSSYLTFEHVARYFADVTNEATIWVSENYNNDSLPASATWIPVKVNPFSDPGGWTFGSTEQISLNDFAGKKIKIALKYVSTATKAGTWELKNFIVKKGEAEKTPDMIYSETFAASLGLFNPISVSGDQKWYVTNGYAYMTGYVTPSNFANVDWLISPEIDLTAETAANFSFDHVTRYFGNLTTEATVWISSDYVDKTRPDSVTWTQVVTSPFVDLGTWTFNSSQKISLTSYCGKKVHIAFKYISTASKAGSWEIKNFRVYSGEANGTDFLPYTVKEAVASQSGGLGWVEGYVVGYSWAYLSQYNHFFSVDSCTQVANIILADTTGNLYASKCLSVQLPRGGIRNGLNLKSNPALFGQKVKVYGNFSSNCGIAGLVNPTKYILPNGTTGQGTDAYFRETFETGLGNFTQYSVSGSPVWNWSSTFKCAIINGYANSTRYVNEDWLISPAITIPQSSLDVALNFSMAGKYFSGSIKNNCKLYISTEYNSGDPKLVSWTQVNIPTYDLSDNFVWTNTGDINLSSYIGISNVRIAIVYTSDGTTTGTGQLEIKGFVVN